ncbi:MAG: hypothetical protein KF746_15010 [Chitinophagaceae bacterium]|nr:hypothetical protein [Chitinophagaceae bacterium]
MNTSSLFFKRMLPVALALGTAWAARGQIGHEYGATWAAAIGIFTVIALSGRQDWYDRLPTIVALGAIAWGAGGMISYGKIVGYGHASDYLNTSYGLVMLMIIGALYGFMGGGITGLALENTSGKKVDWASLLVQMFAGGYLFWGFFIFQLEWLMTPPRSELWAGCMGASLALGWYLYRNGYTHAFRTAFFSALGAGFGFGFGNFLQRMGHASGITFNWWNVMEYSIGFFGGLGMSYGIYSSKKWPVTVAPDKVSNGAGWVFLMIILPAINLVEAAGTKRLADEGQALQVADPAHFVFTWQCILWVMSAMFAIYLTWYYKPGHITGSQNKNIRVTLVYLTWYILISNFISAIWYTPKFVSQHLYWVNLVAIGWMLYRYREKDAYEPAGASHPYTSTLLKWWAAALVIILIISYVAISIGYVHKNAQLRFE